MPDLATIPQVIEQVGPSRRAPLWYFIGHDMGLLNRSPATISLRAALSGAIVDVDLATALARVDDLEYSGRERLLDCALHCRDEGLLNDGDEQALDAFLNYKETGHE